MARKSLLILLVALFTHQAAWCLRDSIFHKLSFWKGATIVYLGSGALKRHLDMNLLDSDVKAYYKTPAFIAGFDHCIYPYASNAYLGLGPFLSGWMAQKTRQSDRSTIQSTFYNLLCAVKFTHHPSYFVRKKLDLCSGYIVGMHITKYQAYKVDGVTSPLPKTSLLPAFGLSLTLRYYFSGSLGLYGEVGIGYKINILNVGFCLRLKRTPK